MGFSTSLPHFALIPDEIITVVKDATIYTHWFTFIWRCLARKPRHHIMSSSYHFIVVQNYNCSYQSSVQRLLGAFLFGGEVMDSFTQGMEQAIKYKDSLARQVVEMFGYDVLKNHEITFEGFSKTGHRINIPITEDMLHALH